MRARPMPWASPTRTSSAAFAGALSILPDFVARPREETELERVLEWCSSERVAAIPYGGGYVGRRRGEPRRRALLQRRDLGRSRGPGPRARGRPGIARRAHPGRRARVRALKSQLGRALADPAPFPAVVRVLHARGLDRHACGRPFRDGVDAHRGLRGVGARDHARRGLGVAEAARIGRRGEPRPHARRLGGNARSDHRGLGARAAAPRAPALGGGALSTASSARPSACARSASRGCTRRTAACSTPARRA